MKTAQPVRADGRMVLAGALCSWSGSDRQAIEIPNHEPGDAVTGIYHPLEGAAGCPFLTVEMTEGTCRQSLLYRSYR